MLYQKIVSRIESQDKDIKAMLQEFKDFRRHASDFALTDARQIMINGAVDEKLESLLDRADITQQALKEIEGRLIVLETRICK